jgi:hypothetical protein
MLLEAMVVILKIRNGFVLGSFFCKPCVYNGLREYGAISFFVLIALSRPVLFAPAPGSVAQPCPPRFSNVSSSRTFLINLAVDHIHLEHQGALFPVRSHALITHCHEKNLTL